MTRQAAQILPRGAARHARLAGVMAAAHQATWRLIKNAQANARRRGDSPRSLASNGVARSMPRWHLSLRNRISDRDERRENKLMPELKASK